MWRFKAPLSGRSGEIRSTDGPSRLNISVTLFPNCVVVPEAGTAVRAKQSGAERGAAQFMEYILIPRSHLVSQFYQLRNGAVSIVPEFCTWHLVFSHLQSVYLNPFSLLWAKFKLRVLISLSLQPCYTFPLTFTAYNLFVMHSVLHIFPSATMSRLYTGPAHLPVLGLIIIHSHPVQNIPFRFEAEHFLCTQVRSDPPPS